MIPGRNIPNNIRLDISYCVLLGFVAFSVLKST